MSNIILTNCQKEADLKITKFLKSDQRFFILTGPPGAGKTFLIKHALDSYLKKEEDTNTLQVVGITLSHQAKNVLNKASIKNCRTFASAYGFKETIYEDEKCKITLNEEHIKLETEQEIKISNKGKRIKVVL